MKMYAKKFRKISSGFLSQSLLFPSVILSCSMGCTGHLGEGHRPQFVVRPYTSTEAMWSRIGGKYSKRDRAKIPTDFHPSTKERPDELGSGPTLPPNVPAPLSCLPVNPPQNTITTSHNNTSHYDSDTSLNVNNHSAVSLPSIMTNEGDPHTSPAANESFTIVPEEQFPRGTRSPTVLGLQQYTVVEGETLMQIARKFYGDELAWKRIYYLNADVLTNPNRIQSGMTLVIP